MGNNSISTDVYVFYERGEEARIQDKIVEDEMNSFGAESLFTGYFFPTNQRDHIFEVPGIVDQLMCLQMAARLSKALQQTVSVSTRYEDTDLGKSTGGRDWRLP